MLCRTLLTLAATCALVLPLAGCGGSGSSSSDGAAQSLKPGEAITMKSLRFHPDKVQVVVGQEIKWRNDEGVPHNVVADSGASFESKSFGKNGTFRWTPTKAGTVKYECTLHPGMDGELDVVAR